MYSALLVGVINIATFLQKRARFFLLISDHHSWIDCND